MIPGRPAMLAVFVIAVFAAAARADVDALDSPFYGEVLYNFHQQKYFSAIVQLEQGIARQRLGHDHAEAELLRGSLYLGYGLHRHAEAIFKRVLADSGASPARDLAWFHLAKLQYQRGLYQAAGAHLQKIAAPLPRRYEDERLTLTALVALRLDDYPAAIEVLNGAAADGKEISYARFNLALAWLNNGAPGRGMALLEQVAELPRRDAESAALGDRVNVALGFQYLEREQFARAREHFQQVQLQGAYSNRALLGMGWAAFGENDYGAAATAWRELAGREVTDAEVLEAYLTLPYLAYQTRRYADALNQYQQAIDRYQAELDAIDAQLDQADFAALLGRLVETRSNDEIGWGWQGEVLAGPLLKPYMLGFVSSHRFQESLKNYRDLLFVQRNLDQRRHDIDVYGDIIDVKEAAYAELKPRAQRRLEQLSDERHAQAIQDLRTRIAYIELDGDAMALTSAEEEAQWQRLRSIDYRLSYNLSELRDKLDHLNLVDRTHALLDKHALLAGVLKWEVMTTYKARLWEVKKKLGELEAENAAAQQRRADIGRIIAAIPDSFTGQRQQLATLEQRLEHGAVQVAELRRRHEAYLYGLIRAELLAVRKAIELYRSQALLSVAHIYDLNLNLQETGQ